MAGTLTIAGGDGSVELELRSLLTEPPEGAGDFNLVVTVRCGHFGGLVVPWIGRPDWEGFIASLEALERTRTGSAAIEGLSPDDFRLELAAAGSAGHLVVRGHVAQVRWNGLDRVLRFGFEMDGGLLPQLVRDARAFAPYPPA
jgi:hypothetical protein